MAEPSFVSPTTVDDALHELDGVTLLLSGGTSLAVLLKQGLLDADRLVWLGRVHSLRGITREPDDTLRIGALTTFAELATSYVVRSSHPVVASAAKVIANPRIRSVATIGGAVAHADPRQDLLPALLAADARVEVAGVSGTRTIRLRDGFFRGFLDTAVEPDEIVTHVGLPGVSGTASETYRRFTPASADDYPTVSVAVRVTSGPSGAITGFDLALGGVASTPLLVTDADQLVGARPSEVDIGSVAELAGRAANPVDDERGSAEYKRAMAVEWTRRVLMSVLDTGHGAGADERRS